MTLSPLTTWNSFYQPCESMLINYKIEFVIFKDFFFFLNISWARLPNSVWLSLKGDRKVSKGGHGLDPHPGESDMATLPKNCTPPNTHTLHLRITSTLKT